MGDRIIRRPVGLLHRCLARLHRDQSLLDLPDELVFRQQCGSRYQVRLQCLREGLPLDQSVYDGCAWSVIGPLSEQSVAQGGMPVEVPDFTRGAWQTAAPVENQV